MEPVPPPFQKGGTVTGDTLSGVADPTIENLVVGVPSELARGSSLHRYIILDRVGEGAAGVVYAAYDPSLDRRVALKVLRLQETHRRWRREKRFLREGQAMARLSHPNVAVVYEVGTFDEHVYLAMEFVDGVDLRTWLTSTPRTVPQILEIFRAAGRGLAAAHSAGIIHRDFKPENVLVDKQGRPRVTDFGLARSGRDPDEAPEPAMDGSAGRSFPGHLWAPLTRTGSVLGTPLYMAPEQHRGTEVTARADQFSFCVALYEAIAGERPFSGASPEEIDKAIGARRIAPAASGIPRWLRPTILRGLEAEPADRWPSMDALLDALSRRPGATWRRALLIGAAAAGLAAAGSVWLMTSDREVCPSARDKIAAIWDGPARQKVRAAFLATGAPHAGSVFGRVERALDARLSGWVDAHREACRATRVRGEQSEAMLDLRMQCLERARRRIAALPELWQKSVKLNQAVRAALTAGEIEDCSDTAALSIPVPPPRDPDTVQRVEAVRRVLDRANALDRAGEGRAGLALARQAVAEARRLGYAPLLAEALHQNGSTEFDYGEVEVAFGILYEAFQAANQAHDDVRAARVIRAVLKNSADYGTHLADTVVLWKMAEAAVARVAHNDDLVADLTNAQGVVLDVQGKWTEAAERFRRAVSLKEKLRGPDDFKLAPWRHNLSIVLSELGQWDEAYALNGRVLAGWEGTLGPEHPYVAMALENRSSMLLERGDYQAAGRSAERAVAIRTMSLPADHPKVAFALEYLAVVRKAEERDQEAQALFERAERIEEQALGVDNPLLASIRNGLAELAIRRGDIAAARRLIDGVLPLLARKHGEDHPMMGEATLTLGAVLLRERQPAAARAAYQRALAILRKPGQDTPKVWLALFGLGEVSQFERRPGEAIAQFERALEVVEKGPGGRGHPRLVSILTGMGRAHAGAGHTAQAVASLERAIAIADANGVSSRIAGGRARFELAVALWPSGGRARAVELARAAGDALAGHREAGEIDRWLACHAAGRPAAPARPGAPGNMSCSPRRSGRRSDGDRARPRSSTGVRFLQLRAARGV